MKVSANKVVAIGPSLQTQQINLDLTSQSPREEQLGKQEDGGVGRQNVWVNGKHAMWRVNTGETNHGGVDQEGEEASTR